jgi:hypothetical protein
LQRACNRKRLAESGLSRIAVTDRSREQELSLYAVDFR